MDIEIIWTKRAEADLQVIYHFQTQLLGEEKAWMIISDIFKSTEKILSEEFIPKVRDHQFDHLGKPYFKLFRGRYKITFRIEKKRRYIVRLFDMRRHPDRNL